MTSKVTINDATKKQIVESTMVIGGGTFTNKHALLNHGTLGTVDDAVTMGTTIYYDSY
jgi:hypothetical protein